MKTDKTKIDHGRIRTRYAKIARFVVKRLKEALYRIWCGANRLGNSGVHTLGNNLAFVYAAGQLLLTWRGKTRMDGVGILFEFYTGLL